MAHMFSLAGRHALVTGATTPLARALALALAEAGATVSVTTLHNELAEEVQANSILTECWAAAPAAGQAKTLDLTDPAAVDAAVDALEREVGPIDILVNAAHNANIKPALEATVEEWRRELDRNVTSVFVACQAVGRRMVPRGRGRIINLVSVMHDRGAPNAALYVASQAAVLGLTKSLAIEWGRGEPLELDRVAVNALGIGFIDGVAGPQGDPEINAILQRYLPLRRLATPEDVQGAVVYLASELANYVQGEMIMVDGGIANRA